MTWRIESRTLPARWAEYTDELTADRETTMIVKVRSSGSVPLTPTGPLYEPTGPGDEIALFLAALGAIPAPQVSGTPPAMPTVPHPQDDAEVAY
jgi:hypothetical protein